ncbi:MAG: Plasmid pRiA4b ORF-3-like protein [Paenibacillus sp.]|nr:Plasmid pRiA4b ORF-3-like protein [Paenibacillus sp.]
MEKVLVFKVSNKGQKSKWKTIAILSSQTLGSFDNIMREAFHHDTHDHLSEFYRGKAFSNSGLGEIEPGGYGVGSKPQLDKLNIRVNEIFEYVYDFGSSSIYQIELIEVQDRDLKMKYPNIVNESKARTAYCSSCKGGGLKVKAEYIVMFKDNLKKEKLCKNCIKIISKQKAYINHLIQ